MATAAGNAATSAEGALLSEAERVEWQRRRRKHHHSLQMNLLLTYQDDLE
jgi:hypothetical protein